MDLGYNIAWLPPVPTFGAPLLGGSYGQDLTTLNGRLARACFAAQLTKAAHGCVMRVWLCEGKDKEGIEWNGASPQGLSSSLLAGVNDVMRAARNTGIKVLWSLLSANIKLAWFAEEGMPLPACENARAADFISRRESNQNLPQFYVRHRALFSDGEMLRDKVVYPFIRTLRDNDWLQDVYGVDIANEASVLADGSKWNWLNRLYGSLEPEESNGVGWLTLTEMLTPSFEALQQLNIPATASIAWKRYWGNPEHHESINAVENAHNRAGTPQDNRLYDVHLYNNCGTIPRALGDHASKLVIGECGTEWDPSLDDYHGTTEATARRTFMAAIGAQQASCGESFYSMFQALVLDAFVMNAKQCSVKALLPWRLLDWPGSDRTERWRSRNRPKSLIGVIPSDLPPSMWRTSTLPALAARRALVRLIHAMEQRSGESAALSLTQLTQLLSHIPNPRAAGFDARTLWTSLLRITPQEAELESLVNGALNDALRASLTVHGV